MKPILFVLTLGLLLAVFRRYKNLAEKEAGSIKDVLLQPEQLLNHAAQIAREHTVSGRPGYIKSLHGRLDKNFKVITEVYKSVNFHAKRGRDLTPASEWLLDNYYKIEEQVKEVRQSLTRERLRRLNILTSGILKGYPRVYAIALELVSHTDGRLDHNLIVDFVKAYQRYSKLSSAEVWSLSLMARLALIENIRHICEKIHRTQQQWEKAGEFVDKKQGSLLPALEELMKDKKGISPSFVEHLMRRLRKDGIDSGEIIDFLDDKLYDYGMTVRDLVEQEHKEQAARKISVGNAITSLNVVAVLDWNDIFESLCAIHEMLMEDPAGVYPQMDFESRDYYRKLVEKIARKAGVPQLSVAWKAVECARKAAQEDGGERERHVGYYIAGGGRTQLLRRLGDKAARDRFHNHSVPCYLSAIALVTLIIVSGFLYYSYSLAGENGMLANVLVVLAVLVPASEVAINLVNWFFTHTTPPTFLPKLEYRDGIPEEASTLVVIPTLLPDKKGVRGLLERLEVYYHANREDNLYFALAGDFKDSDQKTMPEDRGIINEGLEGVKLLNQRYSNGNDIFYFLVRHRQYNEKQGKWMGWERKRGAILELNALLKGSKNTSYSTVSGDISRLKGVKYVITLDADTNLTMDTARKLIGTISHPLNRAVYDGDGGVIRDGYGIIQPRIGIDIESANRSAFTRIFAGQGGIDPYTTAISDIYQDLFGEGIFTGKGIYDLDVFNSMLKDAFPDNTILSHDLLEGSFVRTALASDIELIDGYPSGYGPYMMRLHRWVRGDWQLIRWLYPRIRDREGRVRKNPLSLLSRWKILDNLRRSLVPVSQALLILLGMTVLPGSAALWVLFSVFTIGIWLLFEIMDTVFLGSHSGLGDKLHGNVIPGLRASVYQALLLLIFLPYNAYITMDGIVRTLYRVYVSGRNMLEWVTASEAEKVCKDDRPGYAKKMRIPVGVSVLLLAAALPFKPGGLPYALALGVLWALSPWAAYRISVLDQTEPEDVGPGDIEQLRMLARKTWAYYEDFADEKNNYLAPDNVQIDPPNGVAHRTSPTNIGFMLISILSARDFGYISTTDLVNRIDRSITTIEKMESWRGHLYNWYDTRTLEVLRPYFVSTVDSGNLVGYLICLKQGLKEYRNSPLVDMSLVRGLLDTALLAGDGAEIAVDMLDRALGECGIDLPEWRRLLERLKEAAPGSESWMIKLRKTIVSFIEETRELFPDGSLMDKATGFENWEQDYAGMLALVERINNGGISPAGLMETYDALLEEMDRLQWINLKQADADAYISKLRNEVVRCRTNTADLLERMDRLIERIGRIIDETEFKPLYDTTRHLFSIGYNVGEEKLLNSYYDMLASEARITSYIAIARREVPKKHWFKLGRALSVADGYRGLVSWGGTMFEYLMPLLVLKSYRNTLMDETYGTIVKAQKSYGDKRNVPWGVSESGYYAFDMLLNYQYRAFGVPDFGLKRGLAEDMVVSPYSTLLALPVNPKLAVENLKRLKEEGLEGEYGLYEAVDYTPDRLPRGSKKVIVKSYMAHHQGMGLISLNNYINRGIIQNRFHSDPVMKSAEILLQEKIPLRVIITKEYKETVKPLEVIDREEVKVIRIFGVPDTPIPQCHLLSNGRYSVMLTNGGGGYSKKEGLQVTRWREDALKGNYGMFVFLRNLSTKRIWSSTSEPLGGRPDGYMVVFSQDKAEYYRTDDNIDTHSEIVVTTEDNAEIRRVSLTNHGSEPAVVELTSYLEPVLAPQSADVAHPAFSNLFVRTELVSQYDSIIASRRPRETEKSPLWMVHTITVEGETAGSLQYDTIRGNFIGRGRDVTNPAGLTQPLTNTVGIVLDPIMCLRRRVRVEPGKIVKVSFMTGLADSRDEAVTLAAKYHNSHSIDRAFDLALTRSRVETTYLNLRAGEIKTYQNMISQIVYLSPARKKHRDIIAKNTKGQSGLWSYGISGDLPIVLVSIDETEHAELVRECLKAHEYWRLKGLPVDLVILNRDRSKYLQPLKELVNEIVLSSSGRDVIDKPGGVHVLDASIMPEEDITLVHAAARIILRGGDGPIELQLKQPDQEDYPGEMSFNRYEIKYEARDYPMDLAFFNGYGGFAKDGREYIIKLKENSHTPAPWVNVISNGGFGFLVSENGSGSVWAENSRENKLTPWSNDPVIDPPGEVVYLRDEENGDIWSIAPLPIRDGGDYTIRHGFGYTVFKHMSHGIDQGLTVFVPEEEPVKVSLIRLKNYSNKKRHLGIIYYIRPVMGISEQFTQQHIHTAYDEKNKALIIKNPFNYDFPGRTAFVATSGEVSSYTGDRTEFLGIGGDLANPKALSREGFSNRVGVGYDPCAAIQTHLELDPGEEKDIVLLLGQAQAEAGVKDIVDKFRSAENCRGALDRVTRYWEDVLGVIKVKTPDASMDLMLNYWLMYQTIACRLWARTAFYQSGGAYGFRDQLQDAVNVVYALPQVTRRQILLHCAHQFVEGDVQHWWHPGIQEKGIRTRFTDDLLWLPYATAEYIKRTGDYGILDEEVHFLEDLPLEEGEDERYSTPRISTEKSSVYDHCIRAIERALRFGEHGIPLMGSGDWNDGMNAVGRKGKGESIWLGWFICDTLKKFIPACKYMKDFERSERYERAIGDISRAIEENGWDGSWYRRAYFDDGTPLGSSENTECTIDSIAQSWAVISGQGDTRRSAEAMNAVEHYLVKRDEGIILLFTPPFDQSELEPGYIKGYVPGVRENGGQYTHAAAWVINAFAMLGQGDKAWELFNMINPVNHARTMIECATYKVEPYVAAADVYAVAPHSGRGGWTWYTGAAGWLYRVGLEYMLGFMKESDRLVINPCIPREWSEYSIEYRYKSSVYQITVKNPDRVSRGVREVKLDSEVMEDGYIPLSDDGKRHTVVVTLGEKPGNHA